MTPLKAKQENEENADLLDIRIDVLHTALPGDQRWARRRRSPPQFLRAPRGEYAGHT